MEARHAGEESMQRGLERSLFGVVKVKPVLHWKPKSIEDARVMEFLPRKAVARIWNQPKREKCDTVSKAQRKELSKYFAIRHRDKGFESCFVSIFGYWIFKDYGVF